MEKKMVYWATFYTPSIMFAETWNKYFDKQPLPKDVEFPTNAYAFQLYEREDVVDGEKTYEGKPVKLGKMCYHKDSKISTIDEVKKMDGNYATLISNMKCNNWKSVIFTRWGNWAQPYEPKDMMIVK